MRHFLIGSWGFLLQKKILLLWCTCAKWSKVIKNPNILLTFLTQHHDHPDLFFTRSEHAKVIISHQTSFASLLKTCYGPLGITTTRASVKLINCSILLNFTLFLTVVIPTVNTENATSSSWLNTCSNMNLIYLVSISFSRCLNLFHCIHVLARKAIHCHITISK